MNTDPSKNMKACEDFMLIVLHSHTVAASKHILSTMQFEKVQDLAKEIVVRYTAKIIAKDGMSYTVFISVYYYIRLNYGIV